jgi:hypothetical protein
MAKFKSKPKAAAAKPGTEQRRGAKQPVPKRREQEAEPARGVAPVEGASSPARSQTKRALVIGLLQREAGATLDDLVAATRWLPHTTRAALTRLRQSGLLIEKSKDEAGRTVYRIAPAPVARSRKAA